MHTETLAVSCLRCGSVRRTSRSATGHLHAVECPLCGYLGWREEEASAPLRMGGVLVGRWSS
jgi:hypothetical protein